MRKNRAQEEMVGFVLIVILIAIIGLVFLAINLSKKPEKVRSKELESFIQASMRYSSECFSRPEIRYDLKDLISACYSKETCLNNRTACNVLNETLTGILRSSFKPGEEMPVKAYIFEAFDREANKTIIRLEEGRCTGTISASDISIPALAGNLNAQIEICS
jgi:hypothetical protein